MSHSVYIHGKGCVGVYEPSDITFCLKALDRDERGGTDDGRLGLFRRYLATPLPSGVVARALEEGEDADLLRILADGPPAPLWVPHRFIISIPEYAKMMADRGNIRGELPHERLKIRARVEPPPADLADVPAKARKPKANLSLDDAPPPEWDDIFDDAEAA